jgi:hypothetical protein
VRREGPAGQFWLVVGSKEHWQVALRQCSAHGTVSAPSNPPDQSRARKAGMRRPRPTAKPRAKRAMTWVQR